MKEVGSRKDDAAEFINKVYKTFEQDTINQYVTSIESLNVVKENISNCQKDLTKMVQEYNDTRSDVEQKNQRVLELKS